MMKFKLRSTVVTVDEKLIICYHKLSRSAAECTLVHGECDAELHGSPGVEQPSVGVDVHVLHVGVGSWEQARGRVE